MFDSLDHIPIPGSKRIAVRVSRKAEAHILKGHPWLYENSVQELSSTGKPGDLAVIFDRHRKFVAIGLYDPLSPIIVRILQHKSPETINKDFFESRLRSAFKIRATLLPETTGYRLVHGENDGFPGLVIDKYHRNLVIKLYTVAWIPRLKDLLTALNNIIPFEQIILRLSRGIQNHGDYLYGLKDGQSLLSKFKTSTFLFRENSLWFEADPCLGHKTGFYFDQRENRQRVEGFSQGKRVLNLFAYTGGFSVYAARGGATSVTSVDISSQALGVAKRNFQRNQNLSTIQKCKHLLFPDDAFQFLEYQCSQEKPFDLIIIDPPSFAKKKNESARALRAYQKLTRLALKRLVPGGILVQASCSTIVSPDVFFEGIKKSIQSTGRPFQEIVRTLHPLDHPIGFKEGVYLKCIYIKC